MVVEKSIDAALAEITLEHRPWRAREVDERQNVERVAEARVSAERERPPAKLQVLLEQHRHARRLAAERADRALEIGHVRETLPARAVDQALLADRMARADEAREPRQIGALE